MTTFSGGGIVMQDLDGCVDIIQKIDDIINNTIEDVNTLQGLLSILGDICDMLNEYDKNTVYDVYSIIESSDSLNMVLSNIINIAGDIDISKIDAMVQNSNVLTLLEIYCDFNDITCCDSSKTGNNVSNLLGVYFNDVSRYPVVSRERAVELGKNVKEGDRLAKRELIEGNLRLVIIIAKHYRHLGLSYLDLIQEGNIGLMIASEKYDPDNECSFASFATWWIRHSIIRAIDNQSRLIRIPAYVSADIMKFDKAVDKLTFELGRIPSSNEVANSMNITVDEVEKLLKSKVLPISLESYIDEEERYKLIDQIADNAMGPEDIVSSDALKNVLDKTFELAFLKSVEIDVLKMHYGLIDGVEYNFSQIADKYNVTCERIRQIESGALKKIRSLGASHMRLLLASQNSITVDLDSFGNDFELTMDKRNFARRRCRKNLYQVLCDYSKDEIDFAISCLSMEEIDILKSKFGEAFIDYNGNKVLTKEEFSLLNNHIIPNIRKSIRKNRLNNYVSLCNEQKVKVLKK